MLVQYFPVGNNWYPPEFEKRLAVETYLDWHHLNTRRACASLVFTKYFLANAGKSVSEGFYFFLFIFMLFLIFFLLFLF